VCVYYYSYMYYHDLISTVCITDHTDSTYMNRPRPADIVTNKENPTQNTFFAIFLVTFFEEKKNKQNLDFKGLKRLLFFLVYNFFWFAEFMLSILNKDYIYITAKLFVFSLRELGQFFQKEN